MRHVLAALVVTLAASDASAGPMEFFMGKPPSVGVVRGGAFGMDGTDYLGEMNRHGAYAPSGIRHEPARRSAPRLAHAARPAQGRTAPVVPRPYRP